LKKRELTDRQKKFLEVLFDEANGDVVQAKLLAGYSEHSATSSIVASMKDEIMEATQIFMSRNAPKAAVAMVSGVDDPTQLGLRDRLSAAKELLDRVGLTKTEKVQVEELLDPIPYELEAIELARKYVNQYSYRQVAQWLTKKTGRDISHVGLRKRLMHERQRKNKARTLRKWSEYAKKAIQKAEEIEEGRTGAKA
jgi:phage terminase small subunit